MYLATPTEYITPLNVAKIEEFKPYKSATT